MKTIDAQSPIITPERMWNVGQILDTKAMMVAKL